MCIYLGAPLLFIPRRARCRFRRAAVSWLTYGLRSANYSFRLGDFASRRPRDFFRSCKLDWFPSPFALVELVAIWIWWALESLFTYSPFCKIIVYASLKIIWVVGDTLNYVLYYCYFEPIRLKSCSPAVIIFGIAELIGMSKGVYIFGVYLIY